jgi:hypothetical protein
LKPPFDKESGFFDKRKVSPKSRKEGKGAISLGTTLYLFGHFFNWRSFKRRERKARKETQGQALAFLYSTLPALTLSRSTLALASQGHPKRHSNKKE